MSKGNKNLAAALLKIGDVRGSGKAPGERSGSQVNQEGGSETGHRNLVLVAEDEVVVAPQKSKKRAREETSTRDLDGLSADCLVEREGLDGETSKENEFGAHRPAPISPEDRNFIGFLAGLPSESEWAGMNGRSAVDLLVEMMAVYGQLGVRMAGCAAKARREIDTIAQARNALNSVGQKDERIATLEQEAAEMRVSHEARATKYKNAAKTLVGERDAARAQLQECQEEVKRLQEDLKGKRPAAEVIAEFRESEEYDQELSGAAAKKIHSCWVVAERYVRANPDANWNGFVEEFMKAENATGQGEDEPQADDPARSPPEA